MKQVTITIAVIVVITVTAIALIMMYQRQDSNKAAQQATATNQIMIKDMAFAPSAIKVKVNTTVTWKNDDSRAHSIASYDGRVPHSQDIEPGQTYTYTFAKAGTYSYHCSIHPNMKGTVVVSEK